ncbi:hypothetical protein Misp01_78210 [Microtetraspora sp. NBRC 13810]|nr:hypothetical protein Misp01_78210 [Microtetraspora sp. NBRC 13810]
MRLVASGVRAGVIDWAVAGCAAAALLVTGLSGQHPATGLALLGYALLAVGGLALAARPRAPVVVLVVTGVCAVGYQAAGIDVPVVAYLVAVYAAVRAGHRAITVAASVAMLAALPLAALASGLHDTGEAFAQARGALELAWLVAAGAAGEALRQAERRAEEAERTREETARRRADEERLRIARELHDSLTHQISIIKVQAEVAVHVARRRGEQVPDALLAIQEAGREATRELRATLEALRDDDMSPPRGLDHVAELVERARMTGLIRTKAPLQGGDTFGSGGPSTRARSPHRAASRLKAHGNRRARTRSGKLWVPCTPRCRQTNARDLSSGGARTPCSEGHGRGDDGAASMRRGARARMVSGGPRWGREARGVPG